MLEARAAPNTGLGRSAWACSSHGRRCMPPPTVPHTHRPMPSETEVTGSTALPLVLLSATLYSLYRWPYLRSVCWQVFKLCLAMLCLAICASPSVPHRTLSGSVSCVCLCPPAPSIIYPYPRPEQIINIPTILVSRALSDPDPGRSVCTSPARHQHTPRCGAAPRQSQEGKKLPRSVGATSPSGRRSVRRRVAPSLCPGRPSDEPDAVVEDMPVVVARRGWSR